MKYGTNTIIHLDMDAFYASVEQHDFPELQRLPVIVGGGVERGVVCACSYEARKFGVHSAMPMAKALRLCPAAVVRKVRMGRYQEVSRQVFAVFADYTDRVEPLSIDEAFLDVSGCERLLGTPLQIARQIIAQVKQQTGLTISAGVAPNKFLAKLLSSHCKPAGLMELLPEQVEDFLLPLPVSALWGVGGKTAAELNRLGIRTVAQLRQLDRQMLAQRFGSYGERLYDLSRGRDQREVVTNSAIKSMGAEETFFVDLLTDASVNRELLKLAVKVSARVRDTGCRVRKLMVKIKYADFTVRSCSRTVQEGIDTTSEVYRLALLLLDEHRQAEAPIRLLGIYLSEFIAADSGQGELFSENHERTRRLDSAVDTLRERFGTASVNRATELEDASEKRR